MNTKRTLKWGLVTAAATCAVVAAMPGCELLVDFDRSKIPSEGGMEDVTMPQPDGPVSEGGGETSTDAPSEASEAGMMMDAPSETTTMPEGGKDAGPEGGDASDGATGQAVFGIAPASVTYGTVAVGTTTGAYKFTVTNSGTAGGIPTVNIGGTNAGDFASSGCTTSVAPSTNCTLSVTFKPGAAGSRSATVGVGTGTPAGVSGLGATAGKLTIAPATQDFGGVTSGSTSADFAFTVTNTDTNAATLNTPAIDGQDGAMFALDADGGGGQCGTTLAASGACTIFVHFAPTGTGFRYGSLSITGAGTAGAASSTLTGTGQ
jgi:hypothetical protein